MSYVLLFPGENIQNDDLDEKDGAQRVNWLG